MVNKTQNYGFYKPNEDDFFSVDHISKNAEITDEELKRLSDDKADKNQLEYKVDKIEGKGLSSNDFTNDEKAKLAAVNENAQVNRPISDSTTSSSSVTAASSKAVKTNADEIGKLQQDKVDKEVGKVLSSNDFTDGDKKKLADLVENTSRVGILETQINNLVTNKDNVHDGQILTSNGDGTSAFKDGYIHPTGEGWGHIPSGGITGQILQNIGNNIIEWKDSPMIATGRYTGEYGRFISVGFTPSYVICISYLNHNTVCMSMYTKYGYVECRLNDVDYNNWGITDSHSNIYIQEGGFYGRLDNYRKNIDWIAFK